MITSSAELHGTTCDYLLHAVVPNYLSSKNPQDRREMDIELQSTIDHVLNNCNRTGITSLAVPFLGGGNNLNVVLFIRYCFFLPEQWSVANTLHI